MLENHDEFYGNGNIKQLYITALFVMLIAAMGVIAVPSEIKSTTGCAGYALLYTYTTVKITEGMPLCISCHNMSVLV